MVGDFIFLLCENTPLMTAQNHARKECLLLLRCYKVSLSKRHSKYLDLRVRSNLEGHSLENHIMVSSDWSGNNINEACECERKVY